MNTVFKLGYQAWWLWGVSAAVAVGRLCDSVRGEPWRRRLALSTLLILLPAAGLLYAPFAIPDRLGQRFAGPPRHGLDGEAFMTEGVLATRGAPIALRWDHEAIRWLRHAARGDEVLLEAVGADYTWAARFSTYTALPTIVGWPGHQAQQRSAVRVDLVSRRLHDVSRFYATTDLDDARAILRRYDVAWIVVGGLARALSPAEGLSKLERDGPLWSLAYENPGTRILRVRR